MLLMEAADLTHGRGQWQGQGVQQLEFYRFDRAESKVNSRGTMHEQLEPAAPHPLCRQQQGQNVQEFAPEHFEPQFFERRQSVQQFVHDCFEPEFEPEFLQPEFVIEHVDHEEAAAAIDPETAALQVRTDADEKFARLMEMRALGTLLRSPSPPAPCNRVNIISFRSGQGEVFREKLMQGPELRPVRAALFAEGFPLMLLPSTALVFVPPTQYLDTVNSPTLQPPRQLKRYNLIVAECFEQLIREVLAGMRARQRPYENIEARTEVDLDVRYVVKRTFIQSARNHIVSGVTQSQSTYEAFRTMSDMPEVDDSVAYLQSRVGNPRRYVPMPESFSV